MGYAINKGHPMIEIFAITPASSKPIWFIVVVCAILAVLIVVFILLAYSSQNSHVEVHPDSIKIVGDFWGRTIPLSSISVNEAKLIDLNDSREYRPKWRILGTGLIGYSSGWFRLYNGEKALVYLTNKNSVVYAPTSLGYLLLLTIDEPDKFLDALRSR